MIASIVAFCVLFVSAQAIFIPETKGLTPPPGKASFG
jgi:hypothetical protein